MNRDQALLKIKKCLALAKSSNPNEAATALRQAQALMAQQEKPASIDAYVGAREDAAIWKKRALEAEELNRKFIAEVNGPTYLGEPVKQELPAQKVSESWTDIVAVNLVREGVNKHKARELAAHFLTLFAPPTPPAQEPVAWLHGTTFQVVVSKNRPNSLAAWLPLFAHPAPTQPAQEPVGFTSEESIRALKESGVSVQVYASRGTWFDEPLYTRPAPAMPTHEAIYETIINWDEGGKRSRRELARRIEALYTHSVPPQPALSDDEIWQFWCNRPEVPEGEDDSMEAEFVAACKRAIEAHCRGGASK